MVTGSETGAPPPTLSEVKKRKVQPIGAMELEGPRVTLTLLHLVPMTEDEVIELAGRKARGPEGQEEPERPQQGAELVQPAEPEQQLVKGLEDIETIKYGENEVTSTSTLKLLRRAYRFYGLPQNGSKKQCWERLTRFLANVELDVALDVAQRYQDDLVRHGTPVPIPKDVTPEEKALRELTHLPRADWCEACTATKSRKNAHKSIHLKDDVTG